MTRLLARVAAFFLEPASAGSPRPARVGEAPPAATAAYADPSPWSSGCVTAAVLGGAAFVVPVAAACAGELRARQRAGAAVICVWRPVAAGRPAAGATTPAARRLAVRLAGLDLTATPRGRLAWVALDPDPERAAGELRRCRTAAGVPVVLAVAGPRPPAFEPQLAELELAVAVLAPDVDPALRDVASSTLPPGRAAVLPPLPPGPPRWAAMAGLARLRSLPVEPARATGAAGGPSVP